MKTRASKKIGTQAERPYHLPEGAALRYAPQNELGVVFLFSSLAKRLGLRVEQIRPSFPDCLAYQRTGKGEKRVRIEFEYRSRNFSHDPKKCDWVVCWEHNWPDAPKRLRVVELRRYFGLGRDIWIQPVSNWGRDPSERYADKLAGLNYSPDWTVSSLAKKGDLVLYYRTQPDSLIQDIFKVAGDVITTPGQWRAKPKKDYEAPIRRIATLTSPIHFEDFLRHPVLRHASFVRGSMRGRPNVTEYWPYMYDMIVRRNRTVREALKAYEPR